MLLAKVFLLSSEATAKEKCLKYWVRSPDTQSTVKECLLAPSPPTDAKLDF